MQELDLVRDLITKGETAPALELMKNTLNGAAKDRSLNNIADLQNTATLLMHQLSRSQREYINGTISNENRRVLDNEIASRALMLLSALREIPTGPTSPIINFDNTDVAEKITSSQSHLRSTGWIARGLRVASGVCRLTGRGTRGTGFLIGDDLIVTNNHVIGAKAHANNFVAEFYFEEDQYGSEMVPKVVHLNPDRTFSTCADLDLTVVALAESPGDEIHRTIVNHNASPLIGDHVNIVQHPGGGFKQMAITNNMVVNLYGNFIQYMTDTLPGSSGSPVFDDEWRLIAIHHAGGNMVKNSKGDRLFANEGVLLSKVKEHRNFGELFK